MANEVVELILRINVALAASILLVLALRLPARRIFGARVAYGLWTIPLATAAMCFVPGRTEHVVLEAAAHASEVAAAAAQPPYLLWAWAGGAIISLVILALRQFRFTRALGRLEAREDLGAGVREAQSATHGPAVIGVLRPIIVTPRDFEARFDAEERGIVLAHERAHLAQGDPWINALVLLIQCLSWFNPFVHLGARALRMDQELACDAAVLASASGMRRRYAEAMLKTHIAAAAPIGCSWPPSNLAALKERIAMLKRNLPSRKQTLIGGAAIVSVAAIAAAAAWAAQPKRIVAHAPENEAVLYAPDLIIPASADEDELMGDFDFDFDDDSVVIRDGEVIHERDLTPEEREQIRQAIAEARQDMTHARESVAAAREAMREAFNRDWADDVDPEEIESALEAANEAMAEAHADRIEAAVEAREAMVEARVQMAAARAALDEQPRIQAEIREARREIARAAAEARRAGAEARAEALAAAAEAIEEAERESADYE